VGSKDFQKLVEKRKFEVDRNKMILKEMMIKKSFENEKLFKN
jgi:hypothetical protein